MADTETTLCMNAFVVFKKDENDWRDHVVHGELGDKSTS